MGGRNGEAWQDMDAGWCRLVWRLETDWRGRERSKQEDGVHGHGGMGCVGAARAGASVMSVLSCMSIQSILSRCVCVCVVEAGKVR